MVDLHRGGERTVVYPELAKGPFTAPKGAVRIGIPNQVAAYLFPDIYPRSSSR